jgi:hypothetical protein
MEYQVMPKSMNVECPACGAKIGEPCKTLTNKTMLEAHSKRKNVALAKKYPGVDVNKVAAHIAKEATEGK